MSVKAGSRDHADKFVELRFNLLQSCSWMSNGMRQSLQPFDITPKQYNILKLLADHAPESLSIQEVRNQLADKMSDASRLIDRLEKKGLIDKYPSDTDRRSNRARIKTAGEKLLAKIRREQTSIDEEVANRLNDGELDQLIALLERLK